MVGRILAEVLPPPRQLVGDSLILVSGDSPDIAVSSSLHKICWRPLVPLRIHSDAFHRRVDIGLGNVLGPYFVVLTVEEPGEWTPLAVGNLLHGIGDGLVLGSQLYDRAIVKAWRWV